MQGPAEQEPETGLLRAGLARQLPVVLLPVRVVNTAEDGSAAGTIANQKR